MGYQNDITVRRTVVCNAYCNNTINEINYYNYMKSINSIVYNAGHNAGHNNVNNINYNNKK